MRLKENNALNYIAERAGVKAWRLEKWLADELEKDNVLIDETDCYGAEVGEWVDDLTEATEALHAVGVKDVTAEDLQQVGKLVIMGEGDCPECGCQMELTDGKYIWDTDGYIPKWEEYTCPNCGYSEIEK